jgi:hypothetical protein
VGGIGVICGTNIGVPNWWGIYSGRYLANNQKITYMEKRRGILSWLFGGFSICKFRLSFGRLRFWKVRRPGKKADIDVKL